MVLVFIGSVGYPGNEWSTIVLVIERKKNRTGSARCAGQNRMDSDRCLCRSWYNQHLHDADFLGQRIDLETENLIFFSSVFQGEGSVQRQLDTAIN